MFYAFMLIGTFFTYVHNIQKRGEAPTIEAAAEMARNIGVQAAELIKSIKEITKTQLEYCAKLDSPIFMPVPCVVNKFNSNDDRLEARKVTCDYMAYVCSLAKPMGIIGVLENHSSADCANAIVEDFDYYLENVPDITYSYAIIGFGESGKMGN